MKQYASLLFVASLLAGCAGVRPSGDATKPTTPASDNGAVVSLVQAAKQDAAAGRLPAAAANLERALRIEPRNAVLWHQLARVRLDEGQSAQAEQLATKANSLAGNDNGLRAENWRLIGHARAQNGDHTGAQNAFNKAKDLERQQ